MGLREDKKRRQREIIIENAIALFRTSGYESTSVKKVAQCCEISEATFFNYFPTKDAVLSAWAHGRVSAAVATTVQGEKRPGLRRSMRLAARELAASVEGDLDLARLAFARARLTPPVVPQALIALVREAQAREEARRDLPAGELARVMAAALASAVVGALESGEPAGPVVTRAVDLVVDGARRRNERVRMPARYG